jgi:hypothetical protein
LQTFPEEINLPEADKQVAMLERNEMRDFLIAHPFKELPEDPNKLNAILITLPMSNDMARERLSRSIPTENFCSAREHRRRRNNF